jgi:DNA modification methylase
VQVPDRVVELRRVRAGELIPHPNNWRTHPDPQRDALEAALKEIGMADALKAWQRPDGRLELIDGHLRAEILDQEVPVLVLNLDEHEAAKMLLTFDPLSAMAEADRTRLALLESLVDFDSDVLTAIMKELVSFEATTGGRPKPEPDTVPPVPAEPVTRRGDVWVCGEHRVMCGDCTDPEAVRTLYGDTPPELVLTDPPYCSGGFQEAGRSAGSVGTDAPHKQVAYDRLSTRGYMALLKAMFALAPTRFAYVFTDWRMWVNLFDVVESSGFGARAMIVWDKGSPGMGRGWRSQHELVMWATKETPPFDKHMGGVGNVIQAARTGNDLHTTQKPVDVLRHLAEVADFADPVYDPFGGAGSTMVAVTDLNRVCLTMEIDPAYVDVSVKRWQEYTEDEAVLEATGETFALTEGVRVR